MEYRGVRYTIRIGIERQQWRVALHPPGNEFPKEKTVFGTRGWADSEAHSMIDAWLHSQSARKKPKRLLQIL
jgi:hypothetical protein